MKVVLTDHSFPPTREMEWARKQGHELIVGEVRTEADAIAIVKDADSVLTQFAKLTPAVIAAMNKARVIVRYGIGVDNVDLNAARSVGLPVSNVPDYCVDEVADHTLAFMLALVRCITPNNDTIKGGKWGMGVDASDMRAMKHLAVGVVGFGRIGREVCRRLLAFKCRVLVFDPFAAAAAIKEAGCTPVTLDELLAQSDMITLHCPSTAETRNLIDSKALAKTKRGLLFVNVGRGDLADAEAVTEAIMSGHIRAAALDVFSPEPIPPGHPLLGRPRVIFSSHVASVSGEAAEKLHGGVLQTAAVAMSGELPPNIVNGVKSPRRF